MREELITLAGECRSQGHYLLESTLISLAAIRQEEAKDYAPKYLEWALDAIRALLAGGQAEAALAYAKAIYAIARVAGVDLCNRSLYHQRHKLGTNAKKRALWVDIALECGHEGIALSITGDLIGSRGRYIAGGQIIYDLGKVEHLAKGWTPDLLVRLNEVWNYWHLNNLRAGCEHQRAEGWDRRPIDPSQPTSAYGKFYPGQKQPTWNLLCWVHPEEHPEGLLEKSCPICGYRYGSAWKHEQLPAEVVSFLTLLPLGYQPEKEKHSDRS